MVKNSRAWARVLWKWQSNVGLQIERSCQIKAYTQLGSLQKR